MQYRPVKQSPLLERAEKEMRLIGMGAFLGADPRKLSEILDDDHDSVASLGLSHEMIGLRLEEITKSANKELGGRLLFKGRFEVEIEEHRGMIPCPWEHPGGLFLKNYVKLMDGKTGIILVWSDLSIHMIRYHGFYQGRGSPFRLDPNVLYRLLFSDF